MITKKENALRIIRFDNPEYVMSNLPCYGICYHGCNHEGYDGGGHDSPVGTLWKDIWNTGWVKEQEGIMGFPRVNPLADMDSFKAYTWPDPADERICGKIYSGRNGFDGGDCFLAGSHRDTLWEKAYMLAGMENMMTFFYTEPEYVREILHRIMDFQLGIAEHYIKSGVEAVNLGDDLGTQRGLLMGLNILEEFFIPEYKRLFDLYKNHGVIITFHSCGHIEPLLQLFMDLGVDVLNPVQATANNLPDLYKITDGKMALCGGISTDVIMKGPVADIEKTVEETICLLGRNGGYFCAPDQYLPFPAEHLTALNDAVDKYGVYPL